MLINEWGKGISRWAVSRLGLGDGGIFHTWCATIPFAKENENVRAATRGRRNGEGYAKPSPVRYKRDYPSSRCSLQNERLGDGLPPPDRATYLPRWRASHLPLLLILLALLLVCLGWGGAVPGRLRNLRCLWYIGLLRGLLGRFWDIRLLSNLSFLRGHGRLVRLCSLSELLRGDWCSRLRRSVLSWRCGLLGYDSR